MKWLFPLIILTLILLGIGYVTNETLQNNHTIIASNIQALELMTAERQRTNNINLGYYKTIDTLCNMVDQSFTEKEDLVNRLSEQKIISDNLIVENQKLINSLNEKDNYIEILERQITELEIQLIPILPPGGP